MEIDNLIPIFTGIIGFFIPYTIFDPLWEKKIKPWANEPNNRIMVILRYIFVMISSVAISLILTFVLFIIISLLFSRCRSLASLTSTPPATPQSSRQEIFLILTTPTVPLLEQATTSPSTSTLIPIPTFELTPTPSITLTPTSPLPMSVSEPIPNCLWFVPAIPIPSGSIIGYHQVVRGETIYCIARGYGVSPSAIAQTNGLNSPRVIHSGNVLIIPSVQWQDMPPGPLCSPQFISPFVGVLCNVAVPASTCGNAPSP